MSHAESRLEETVTLSQASELIRCLAHTESLLLLSPPGVGKSETVLAAARSAGLPCRSLLGTQIAPEDVSGVPRIVGERSVFCPPRLLLPETDEPFCLFLDELPACTPDIQKAFYSLLLERRIGEHKLPAGSWVVAAGNRAEDRALVRTISSALLNRVIVLNVRVDVPEWIAWALTHDIDSAILSYILESREALLRPIPREPVPFSTPRAWALLSEALKLAFSAEEKQQLPRLEQSKICRALASGRISSQDAVPFANWWLINQHTEDEIASLGYHGMLRLAISDLDLSQRAVEALQGEDITIVQDLVVHTRTTLRNRSIDSARWDEIEAGLARKGLWLGMQLS